MLLVSEALRGGDDGYEVGVHVGMAPAGEVRSLAATAQAASRIHLPCSGMIFLFHLRVWLRLGWINGPPPSAQQHFRIGSFSFMEKRSGEGRPTTEVHRRRHRRKVASLTTIQVQVAEEPRLHKARRLTRRSGRTMNLAAIIQLRKLKGRAEACTRHTRESPSPAGPPTVALRLLVPPTLEASFGRKGD
eukprot:s8250_g2.t1